MTDYSKMTMGELIDARKENNELKSDANKVVKGYEEIEHAIDAAIIVQLDSQQSTRAANATGSVSISSSEEPNVDDWDKLYAHIMSTQDFALLHRRISATAFRELAKAGQIPPGLSSRTVRRVNFRSL
jgi:hypothetical protein